MIQKKHISVLLFLVHIFLCIYGTEKKFVLGGAAGWPELQKTKNITKTSGRFGKEAVSVSSAAAVSEADTDLLLNFENAQISDLSGNYSVLSSALVPVTDTIMGKYAAFCKGEEQGVDLKGEAGSIFGRSGPTGSFTLSFWLNPALAESGETILSWRSSRNIDGQPVYQMIAAAFFNNKIEWAFTNVFSIANSLKDITVTGKHPIIPNTWAFHTLCFDEETGLLEYFINGRIEALLYTTANGRAGGSVFTPVLGVPAELNICPAFTGKIDEFCIQKSARPPDYRPALFNTDGGYFESVPIGPFPAGSSISAVHAVTDTPAQTAVRFFIRAGNNYHIWTDTYPEWQPVDKDTPVSGAEGVWFQVAASLHTDGAGTKTPSITEITLAYKEKEAPFPPVRIFAQAGDGYADISWLASAGVQVSGYTVYYGEKPGEYLGSIALEGRSPVDAGNTLSIRLNGLKNGRIYYFAVAAYEDSESARIQSSLSHEVYARPLKGLP